ncbi:hypothetical protein B2J93_174 [Marssonina coronariae]|uniref:Uncharacterized protein n=1 Tax=Diplocarpon coronariae TaxID=2795749 RepID=A0A218Z9S3_9HELO|nr:hypothetical protein B2J93_174 [Marssonina coronariae]
MDMVSLPACAVHPTFPSLIAVVGNPEVVAGLFWRPAEDSSLQSGPTSSSYFGYQRSYRTGGRSAASENQDTRTLLRGGNLPPVPAHRLRFRAWPADLTAASPEFTLRSLRPPFFTSMHGYLPRANRPL